MTGLPALQWSYAIPEADRFDVFNDASRSIWHRLPASRATFACDAADYLVDDVIVYRLRYDAHAQILTAYRRGEDGRAFLTERLNALAQRRTDLEHGLAAVEEELRRSKGNCVSAATVAEALANFTEVYGCLKPYEQRELMHLVLARALHGDVIHPFVELRDVS